MLQHKSFYKVMAHKSDTFQLSITAAIEELRSENQALEERLKRLEHQSKELQQQSKELQTSLDSANTKISGLNERLLDCENKLCGLSRKKDPIESLVESLILLRTESRK